MKGRRMSDQITSGDDASAPFESSVKKLAEIVEREIAVALDPLHERVVSLERRLDELDQRVVDHEKRRRREMRP